VRRAVAVLLLLCGAAPAWGFEPCTDPAKRMDFDREVRTVEKILSEKRFAELELRFEALLTALDAGSVDDVAVDRAFTVFETLDLGPCIPCGPRDPLPLLRDWLREHPSSASVRLAMAYQQLTLGLAVRGEKPAESLAPSDVAAMNRSLGESARMVAEVEVLDRARPLTWALRLRIAAPAPSLAGGSPSAIFARASARYPRSALIRVRFAEASLPMWGGSLRQIQSSLPEAGTLRSGDERYLRFMVAYRMGQAAEEAHDDDAALLHYAEAAPLCPGFHDANSRLTQLHLRHGRYAEAIAAATLVIEHNPTATVTRVARAKAYREQGRFKESFADYERATLLGYRPAFAELAWFYETGTDVPRDPQRAKELRGAGR
jgi:hypothetical protein